LCCACVFLCLCTGSGLATSWSPVQGVLPLVLDLVTEVKRKVSWRRPRPEWGCRATGGKELTTEVQMRYLCFLSHHSANTSSVVQMTISATQQ
jgi:hypothetical protein